jgi:hypothetical protein
MSRLAIFEQNLNIDQHEKLWSQKSLSIQCYILMKYIENGINRHKACQNMANGICKACTFFLHFKVSWRRKKLYFETSFQENLKLLCSGDNLNEIPEFSC